MLEGELYATANTILRRLTKRRLGGNKGVVVPRIARAVVRPRWKRLLDRTMRAERDVAAVIFLQTPLNHLEGLPRYLRREFGVPVVCYDGDLPVSLPRYGGYTFNYYLGADLGEYDAFIVNSEGAKGDLFEMGASKVYVIHYGADPEVYSPAPQRQFRDIDIFFAGFGSRFRENWIHEMITAPSRKIECSFVVSGPGFDVDLGRAKTVPKLEFSAWRRYCWRSKIALNITRDSHSLVPGTSSSRPFELASMGCCVVSSPYPSLGEWFRIGKEILIVENAKEAVETYKWLLSDEETRMQISESARQRVLREHTFRHRARELLEVLNKISLN
jgi:spore maturation protein CgeB